MTVLSPRTLAEACSAAASNPSADLLAGGTDLMVEVNSGHRRPTDVISLGAITELREWSIGEDRITIGSGVTFANIAASELATYAPALAMAARTVGSPQIRNAATIGGNLGTGSPAGDSLPVLAALNASVVLTSVNGDREISLTEFCVGPKRTDRQPGELITAVRIDRLDGPQEFCKLGTRQAMVISVVSVAVVTDIPTRSVRVGLGAVGPVPLRAPEAEVFAEHVIDWSGTTTVNAETCEQFAQLVRDAARPIDDHRSTADYRRHAAGVLAGRALRRIFP